MENPTKKAVGSLALRKQRKNHQNWKKRLGTRVHLETFQQTWAITHTQTLLFL